MFRRDVTIEDLQDQYTRDIVSETIIDCDLNTV